MKKILMLITAAGAVALSGTACRTEGALVPEASGLYDVENHQKVVLLSKALQRSVTVEDLKERLAEDGRLEVTANFRNRLRKRIQVQVNCVFKDEYGFSTGDETPFQTLIITERAQESVRFISMNPSARKYTIRIREAH